MRPGPAASVGAVLLLATGCAGPAPAPGAAWRTPPAASSASSPGSSPAGSSPAGPAGAVASSGGAAPAGAGPAGAVPEVLRFTGTTLDGARFDAASLAGRPALLWFWAPWCATCAAQAQSVNDLADSYGDRLGILGVGGMGSTADMHRFVADLQVTAVPTLDDGAGVLWRRFRIAEQSTFVLIDRAGRVRATGYLDDLQLTEHVEALVA